MAKVFQFSILLLLALAGCSEKIDFENDVPQRAKAISQQQVDAMMATLNSSKAREQYRQYLRTGKAAQNKATAQAQTRTLKELQEEKKALEAQIAQVAAGHKKAVCPTCHRAYEANAKGVKPKQTIRLKKPAKKSSSSKAGSKIEVRRRVVKPSNLPPKAPKPVESPSIPDAPIAYEPLPSEMNAPLPAMPQGTYQPIGPQQPVPDSPFLQGAPVPVTQAPLPQEIPQAPQPQQPLPYDPYAQQQPYGGQAPMPAYPQQGYPQPPMEGQPVIPQAY